MRGVHVYDVGQTIYYRLKDESTYELIGNASVTCQSDGTWSEPPICRTFCYNTPEIVNGECDMGGNKVSVGHRITCSCFGGFQFQSYRKATCGQNGEWSRIPNCVPQPTQPPVGCDNAPQIRHGSCERYTPIDPTAIYTSEYNIGEFVKCTCDNGYHLEQPTQSGCSLLALETKVRNAECHGVNGTISGTINRGQMAICECETGFQLKNRRRRRRRQRRRQQRSRVQGNPIKCLGFGAWDSTNLPSCLPVSRNFRTAGARFGILDDPLSFSKCDGPNFVKVPRCVANIVTCPAPPILQHAGCTDCSRYQDQLTAWQVGDSLRYSVCCLHFTRYL